MCLWDGLAEHMMSEYWILDLYALAEETKDGWLFPKEKKSKQIVDGVEIPMHLIGYTAYPLWQCLMKGYTQRVQLTSEQIHFTHTLSSARMVLENAFGRLNGRWRCAQKEHFLPEWTVQDNVGQPSEIDLDSVVSDGGHSSAKIIRETLMANLHSIN